MVAGRPRGFPRGVVVSRRRFENWAQAIQVDSVWTCAPRTPDEVVAVVNWAWRHRYRVRALGRAHGWSPLALAGTPSSRPRVVLVDTTQHLVLIRWPGSVRPQWSRRRAPPWCSCSGSSTTPASGWSPTRRPGILTVGGVLGIDGHGTAIPARGEHRARGETFGSVSNLVLSLTTVVWSDRRRRYVLRTFDRDDPACASPLTHLGRALGTSVTLRAGPRRNMRCVSHTIFPRRAVRGTRRPGTHVRELPRVERPGGMQLSTRGGVQPISGGRSLFL
jgi:FAD/FMN-containing dehydrogenase